MSLNLVENYCFAERKQGFCGEMGVEEETGSLPAESRSRFPSRMSAVLGV